MIMTALVIMGLSAPVFGQSSDADPALAAEEFRKAIGIAPNLAAAWFNLGRVQAKMGDCTGAIDGYNQPGAFHHFSTPPCLPTRL
jgi:hypothetical protein